MPSRVRRRSFHGWLHGEDLKEKRERELWAKQMRIKSLATYVVGEIVDEAVRGVVHKVLTAELTDSESDGTVGSDVEYEHAIDAEWDLVAI
jgi:hypothetical protein